MQITRQIVVTVLVVLATGSATCFASAGGSMGKGSMGGGQNLNSMPRSPQDEAVDAYNAGVRDVGKAKDYENDAAKAGKEDKRARALGKAQKAYATALDEFNRAADKNPNLYQAWNYVGFCQRHLGNFEAALNAYGKALDLNPRYGEAYEYRAEAYLGLNRIEEAKASYITLFSAARPLADELMTSMHRWVEDRQHDAKGVSADDLAAFAKWVDERTAVAQQTASLWLGTTKKPQVGWD
jgi:tetratricopeptide (TPR) repeat protein